MFHGLFAQAEIFDKGLIRPNGFDLVQRLCQSEINNAISYYNSRVHSVKSNHLLCRLLITASPEFDYDNERFAQYVQTKSPYLAKHFGMTSSIGSGKTNDSIFYGEDIEEILLFVESYFNPFETIENWQNINAVKVLNHPFSCLTPKLFNGKKKETGYGISVVAVDIALLLMQYRGWLTEQKKKMQETGSALSESHFVSMYVLPQMLKSHTEIAIFNRLANLNDAAPMTEMLVKNPFVVMDYHAKLDKSLKDILRYIKDKPALYSQSLKAIPCAFEPNMQQALLLPDIAPTVQVWWALVLSRASMLWAIMRIGGKKGINANSSILIKTKEEVSRLLDSDQLRKNLAGQTLYDQEYMLKEILSLIDNKE